MFYPEVFCPSFLVLVFPWCLAPVRAPSAYVITWQLVLPGRRVGRGVVQCRHDGQFSPSTHRVMGAQSYSGGCLWSLRLPDRQPWCHHADISQSRASGAQFKLGASQGKQCQHLGKRGETVFPAEGPKRAKSQRDRSMGTRGPGLVSVTVTVGPGLACAGAYALKLGGCCQVVSVSFAPVVSATPKGVR